MISLTKWKEFGSEGSPSIKTAFASKPYEGMEEIAAYLENGKIVATACGADTDVFTGERIPGTECLMNDGEYSWINSLSYYVRKYYFKPPEAFEKKVLNLRMNEV